ncbi:MAG TPA: aldo/keto reductase [Gammaproteobacteria bacterium]|jgi:aryl-alcohol dehydrogenase-like predicted oxidoreductase|nr:aldo/keto reductase [Gammaproteobacteria bacterium]
METLEIADTGLAPTRIGLGTWAIGGWAWGGADNAESIRTIHAALDRGITLIDTAPVYGFGRSEEVVGLALAERGRRDTVVLATKCGLEWHNDNDIVRNARAPRIRREVEESLRRLRTDYIDIYQVHWPDKSIPVEDTAAVMAELRAAGKIRAIGVSNFDPETTRAFAAAAPLHVSQSPYNLFERGIENDVLPYCEHERLTLLAYGALCRGLLSGKMNRDRRFDSDDLRSSDPKFQPPRFAQYLDATARLDRFARDNYGRSVLALAVRWILDRYESNIALWGARRPAQLEEVGDIDGWHLDADALAEIDRILKEAIHDPVGPEFMAPPHDQAAA